MINSDTYKEEERKQRKHRQLNTAIGIVVLLLLTTSMAWAYTKFEDLNAEQRVETEIAQIVSDEGYKKCAYKDSRNFPTIGFGHLIIESKDRQFFKSNCITARKAVELLRFDYDKAAASVDDRYYWASGEVRLVLINMTYQMGATGVSKFKKTLGHLQDEAYDSAAIELLNSRWANQTPRRAARLAGRILSLNSTLIGLEHTFQDSSD